MEKLAFKVRICRLHSAVELIPKDRLTDEGQMHSNLVRATSFDRNLEQRTARKSLEHAKTRHSRPA